MLLRQSSFVAGLVAVALAVVAPAPGWAQDERKTGWFDTAELSFVLTAGNSQTTTLGAKNTLERVWERATFKLEAGGIRTESTVTTRTASGSPTDFVISEEGESQVTAENYFARGRYDRNLSDRVFLFGGLGWERNTFAGFDNRYAVIGGVGNSWFDRDDTRFRTDYGVTYTVQDNIVGARGEFAGARVSYDYWRKVLPTTDFYSTLILDENLDETEDFRADFTNSVAVAMSEKLALKTSLQLLYDNQPSLVAVPLEGTPDTTVLAELDELDSIFTVALVAKF